MAIPFEPTRSYVYNATRYELLPRIVEIARDFGDTPFLLRDLSKKVLADTYTPEQLEIQIKKAKSDTVEKLSTIFGFYIPFIAKNLGIFERIGEGQFKNVSSVKEAEEIEEADAEAEDDDLNVEAVGVIYAYSFPLLERQNEKFPIKVGLTRGDDAEARVRQQCRQTCCFEKPKILKTWKVLRVGAVERAIHLTLEARGSKRDAPGGEWFDTTIAEVESIVKFIQP